MSASIVPGRRVVIYADGACRGNPGPGGWGVVLLLYEGDELIREKHLSGRKRRTTNNVMELTAALKGLGKITHRKRPVTVVSDSQLLINGMSEWLSRWKARGWKKADRKPVANLALWQHLDVLASSFNDLNWEWVQGHAGHEHNEMADTLAQAQADRLASQRHPQGLSQ